MTSWPQYAVGRTYSLRPPDAVRFRPISTGGLLAEFPSKPPRRHRMLADTFALEFKARGMDPTAYQATSLNLLDAEANLLWCRRAPNCYALRSDGLELAYIAGSDIVRIDLTRGTPSVHDALGPLDDLVYADDDQFLVAQASSEEALLRIGRDQSITKHRVRSGARRLVFGNERMIVLRTGWALEVFDPHWGCIRQRLPIPQGSRGELRRVGDAVAIFQTGAPTLTIGEPWWGSQTDIRTQAGVHDVASVGETLHVLIGADDDAQVMQHGSHKQVIDTPGAIALWGSRVIRGDHSLPLAIASCDVGFSEHGPHFASANRVFASKMIVDRNPVGATLAIGSTLLVGARHMLVAHSLKRRDHRTVWGSHADWITALTAIGSNIASAGADGRVRIWDREGTHLCDRMHPAPVWDIAGAPSGLVTVCNDGVVRLYRAPARSDVHSALHLGLCHAVAATQNLIVVASTEGITMLNWDGVVQWTAKARVGTLAAHPSRDLFALGSPTGEVFLARPGEHLEISRGHTPNPSVALGEHELWIGSGTPEHPATAIEILLS